MLLDLTALQKAEVAAEPFHYMAAPDVLSAPTLRAVCDDFPIITGPGVYPLSALTYGAAFAQLIEEIRSPALQTLLEQKFALPLAGKPLLVTVRGRCQRRDGRIHVDSRDKLLTCLLYLNPPQWQAEGGRLRLLRGPDDLTDMIAEIPPLGGNFLAFKRAENSWHGHYPFEGTRRVVMFNWLTSNSCHLKHLSRHRLSAVFKGIADAGQ